MTPPNRRPRLVFALAVFVAAGFGVASAARAADTGTSTSRNPGEVSTVVQNLSQRIESPFCPGKTLAMCPSGNAAEVRRDIQRMAREGKSPAAIERTIIDKYGEQYRLKPPAKQDNYALLGLVGAGLVVCIGAVGWFVRRDDELDTDPDRGDDEDDEWDDRDEVYLEDLRDQYRD